MSHARQVFHIEGITDLSAQLAAARRQRDTIVLVHEHRQGEECSDRCHTERFVPEVKP